MAGVTRKSTEQEGTLKLGYTVVGIIMVYMAETLVYQLLQRSSFRVKGRARK